MSRKALDVNEKTHQVEKTAKGVSLDDIQEVNEHKTKRENKIDERFNRDMMYGTQAYKRNLTATMEERDRRYARLHDLHHNRDVTMEWDINPETISRQLFKLTIRTPEGKIELLLSAVELQKYLRWV